MNNHKDIGRKSASISLAAFILAGCASAPVPYKFNLQTYATRSEAQAARTRSFTEAESAIPAGTRQLVDRKVLVVIPTASAISKTFEGSVTKRGGTYAQPGTAGRAHDDFNAETMAYGFNSVASSIKKSNIYKEVSVMSVDSTTSNIQPTQSQDIIAFYLAPDNLAVTTYYLSAKNGKQVVAIDTGASTISERRKSMIDDIKAKALQ